MGCLTDSQLEELSLGRLNDADAVPLRAHLESCSRCRNLLEECRANQLFIHGVKIVLPPQQTAPLISTLDASDDSYPSNRFYQEHLDEPAEVSTQVRIPGYRILREIHRGAQGIVYEAEQVSIGRKVALKVIREGALADDRARRRFEREVESAAGLRHPNIVTVYDSGVHGGNYYFAMEYIDGQRLDDYLQGRELSLDAKLALFCSICDGVNHAHQRGIIHRDLKPSNILIEEDGQPRVVDFGLAKTADPVDRTELSLAGQVLGTLAYMSPEQARGDPDLDIRTDVYSLGVVLYQMLTGRFPYEVTGPLTSVLRNIAEAEPLHPAALSRSINNELETILLKALSKDREHRYGSVAALGDDVRRYLNGEPIEARRDSSLYVLSKTLARHRVAVAVAVVFLAVISAFTTAMVFVQKGAHEAWIAEASQRSELTQRTYASGLSTAYRAWEDANVKLVVEMLERNRPVPGGNDLRGFEWFYLWDQCHQEHRTLRGQSGEITAVAFSPDGSTLAAGSSNGAVTLWQTVTWTTTANLKGHEEAVGCVAYSHDGTLLATGGEDNTVLLWDTSTYTLRARLAGHLSDVRMLAFAPDDRKLASISGRSPPSGEFGELILWDVAAGHAQDVLGQDLQATFTALAFAPDGRTLATGGLDSIVRLWDVSNGNSPTTLTECKTYVQSLAFSADGATLAVSSGAWNAPGEIALWDIATRQIRSTLDEHTGVVRSLAYSPDGRTLASGSLDTTIRLWDAETGQMQRLIRGHEGWVTAVAFDPQSGRLASGDRDGQVKVWDIADHAGPTLLQGHTNEVWGLAFSPDGRKLATASPDSTARLWDVEEGKELVALTRDPGWVISTAFSPDGELLATTNHDATVRLWNTSTHELIANPAEHTAPTGAAVFTPDGRTLVSTGDDATVRLWNVATHQAIEVLEGHSGPVRGAAITADGRILVTSGGTAEARDSPGEICIWDFPARQRIAHLTAHAGWAITVAVSPDGKRFATAGLDRTAKLWELPGGRELHTLRGHGNAVTGVAFSPDGRTLATASWDGTVRLWHVATGRELAVLKGHTSVVCCVAFSPDGTTLASAGGDRVVRLWRAPRPQVPANTRR